MKYTNYLKFNIEAGERYDFEGLEITNKTTDNFHIFIKKLDEEIIDIEADEQHKAEDFFCCCKECKLIVKEHQHPAHCCCSQCLGY